MDTLRENITRIIEEICPVIKDGDTKLAAMEILRFLEQEIGLQGNGWFDNDPEMEDYLENYY